MTDLNLWAFVICGSTADECLSQAETHLESMEQDWFSLGTSLGNGLTIKTTSANFHFEARSPEDHHFDFDRPVLTLAVDFDALRVSDGSTTLDEFVRTVQLLHRAIGSEFSFGMVGHRYQSTIDEGRSAPPQPLDDIGDSVERIAWPTWLMLFSPGLVEAYGQEWLQALPIDRIRELEDGGILLVASENPTDLDEVNARMSALEEAFQNHPDHPVSK